jgi:putative ABC transport system substrate-binding protein
MQRREFIAGRGGVVARAQQGDRVRRIGVHLPFDENDPVSKTFVSAFTQALAGLGWIDGRNVRMDLRWNGGDDTNRIRALAKELVGLQPDIILAGADLATVAVQRETRTIPIVFAAVSDPVASGLVATLDRPGGNATGFGIYEPAMAGKWLDLLSEIAPGLKRAAIMFNPDRFLTQPVYMPALETAARSLKVEAIITPIHSDVEIETAITALGREPGRRPCRHAGWIHDGASCAAHNGSGPKQRTGGLCANHLCQRRRFALLRSRYGRHLSSCRLLCRSHLRGAKPADLPVQLPTKFEMAVNLKTAKALGLTIPETLLATADEVIQ